MARPVILTVDDEVQVLNAIERDLRRRFGGEYRVLKAPSGHEALRILRELKRRGAAVALLLVDQRMPEMSGTEFLTEAIRIYPDARRALLTAYADTQAAIQSINTIGLDHYFLKPWDPPERELYPVLDELLAEWAESVRLPYEGIRVLGTLWSARSHAVKDFLSRNQIPYRWLDVEKEEEAKALLAGLEWPAGPRNLEGPARNPGPPPAAGEALAPAAQAAVALQASGAYRPVSPAGAGGGLPPLPVVLFPDGSFLADPEPRDLARRVGLQTQAARPFYDFVIVGGGPAGLAAAVYGGSEGLRTVLIEREATGGQAGTSALIENYLGFPKGLSGADLARRATDQARRFGVEVLNEEVVGIRVEDPYRFVRLAGGGELSCHALLISTGVTVRRLEAPGVERLTGAGIYYGAAWTEAAYYRDCEVLVVGGANSAGQGALFLARYARSVYLSVRSGSLDAMSRYLIDQIEASPNIHLLLQTEVAEAKGDTRLQSVVLKPEMRELPVAAMFLFIGTVTHTQMLDGLVERDPVGFILTGPDLLRDGRRPKGWTPDRDPFLLETSVPGIFAAGDVRHQSMKRVASAVGEGAVAVALVHQYLKTV